MLRKLNARGYDGVDINQVIAELSRQGLQSDDRFTEAFVHSRVEKGYGPVRIIQELRERSISDDLINQFINIHEVEWGQRACQVRKKRFGQKLPSDFKDKAKQSRFLQYRGFTNEQLRCAFSECEV